MRGLKPIHPDHTVYLWTLRVLGFALAVPGAVLVAMGFISFFSSFGTSAPPERFWLAFVGMPMLGIGAVLLKFGFVGKITRFIAQEVTPVGVDSFHYAAQASHGSVRHLADAVRQGLGQQPTSAVHCSACGETNNAGARFCQDCGTRLSTPALCTGCGRENPIGAKFCNACGKGL